MSTKLRKSSAKSSERSKPLTRPFEERILRRAAKLSSQYRLILEQRSDDVYLGSAVEMPTVFAEGPTPDHCVESTRHALTLAVATIMERGQTPPAPVLTGKRDAQVNVRLGADEKLLLLEAARRHGFTGLSDFIRSIALRQIMAGAPCR